MCVCVLNSATQSIHSRHRWWDSFFVDCLIYYSLINSWESLITIVSREKYSIVCLSTHVILVDFLIQVTCWLWLARVIFWWTIDLSSSETQNYNSFFSLSLSLTNQKVTFLSFCLSLRVIQLETINHNATGDRTMAARNPSPSLCSLSLDLSNCGAILLLLPAS